MRNAASVVGAHIKPPSAVRWFLAITVRWRPSHWSTTWVHNGCFGVSAKRIFADPRANDDPDSATIFFPEEKQRSLGYAKGLPKSLRLFHIYNCLSCSLPAERDDPFVVGCIALNILYKCAREIVVCVAKFVLEPPCSHSQWSLCRHIAVGNTMCVALWKYMPPVSLLSWNLIELKGGIVVPWRSETSICFEQKAKCCPSSEWIQSWPFNFPKFTVQTGQMLRHGCPCLLENRHVQLDFAVMGNAVH